jgi:hypothetical protein
VDLAFSTWRLAKPADHLAAAGIAQLGREAIRQILHDAGINWLASETWKASTNLQFIEKTHKALNHRDQLGSRTE